MENRNENGDLRNPNIKYTSRELDTIVFGNLLNNGFSRMASSITSREKNHAIVYTLFTKANRGVAVFATTNDKEPQSSGGKIIDKEVTGTFTLEAALKFYTDTIKEYGTAKDFELLIPICLCGSDPKHLGYLKIIKEDNGVVARYFDPTSHFNFNPPDMEKLLKKHFGDNVRFERLNLSQEVKSDGINDGPYTAENINSDLGNTTRDFPQFSIASAESLREKQFVTLNRSQALYTQISEERRLAVEAEKASEEISKLSDELKKLTIPYPDENPHNLTSPNVNIDHTRLTATTKVRAAEGMGIVQDDADEISSGSDSEPQSAASNPSSRSSPLNTSNEDVTKKARSSGPSPEIMNAAHINKLNEIKKLVDKNNLGSSKDKKTQNEIQQIIIDAKRNPSTAEEALKKILEKANKKAAESSGLLQTKPKTPEQQEWQKIVKSINDYIAYSTRKPDVQGQQTPLPTSHSSQKGGTKH